MRYTIIVPRENRKERKMSKEEFVNQLLTLLDSAPADWPLFEDEWGNTVFVTDLMELISVYNEESEE
jgi:hypothetical protein